MVTAKLIPKQGQSCLPAPIKDLLGVQHLMLLGFLGFLIRIPKSQIHNIVFQEDIFDLFSTHCTLITDNLEV